eukprot:6498023-Pyramimonas_sp.AAC.1
MQCNAKRCRAPQCNDNVPTAMQCDAKQCKAMQSDANKCKAMRSNSILSNKKQCKVRASHDQHLDRGRRRRAAARRPDRQSGPVHQKGSKKPQVQ